MRSRPSSYVSFYSVSAVCVSVLCLLITYCMHGAHMIAWIVHVPPVCISKSL